jgi:chromosome segregation ATPase
MEWRTEEERARLEGEYRRVLESSVEFERTIRERWRQTCRAKNERIAELEARVAELEGRIEKAAAKECEWSARSRSASWWR